MLSKKLLMEVMKIEKLSILMLKKKLQGKYLLVQVLVHRVHHLQSV